MNSHLCNINLNFIDIVAYAWLVIVVNRGLIMAICDTLVLRYLGRLWSQQAMLCGNLLRFSEGMGWWTPMATNARLTGLRRLHFTF
jgi:hypothetical protein